ncbi:unnamed protein product [Rotaria sp. Silwood2]|nr:unnamed protein product [Rotaria sp. Silwood2]CAF4208787.1 unnamed protein product [Rotaria sp. Silwood2]CAF4277210.1 unnamed protein product [Rotaria sp. Silwood2]
MCNKWKALPEFHDVLTTIDNNDQTTNTTSDDSNSEDVSDDECMDGENVSDQPVNATSSKNELMDDDYGGDQILGVSSSDNQSFDDAARDDHTKDEENSSDGNSVADDMMTMDEYGIIIPIEVAISSKSARVALAQHFVPHHLGLDHLTRQDIIDKYTSPIATRLLTEGRNPCILVLDGTYLYIQKRFFKEGENVLVRDLRVFQTGTKWTPGTLISKSRSRIWSVKIGNNIWRRHENQILNRHWSSDDDVTATSSEEKQTAEDSKLSNTQKQQCDQQTPILRRSTRKQYED